MDIGRPIMWSCDHTLDVPRFLTRGSIVVDLGANKGEFAIDIIRDLGVQMTVAASLAYKWRSRQRFPMATASGG